MTSEVCDSAISMNQFSHSVQVASSMTSIDAVRLAIARACHGEPGDPARTASFDTMNSRFWNAA